MNFMLLVCVNYTNLNPSAELFVLYNHFIYVTKYSENFGWLELFTPTMNLQRNRFAHINQNYFNRNKICSL